MRLPTLLPSVLACCALLLPIPALAAPAASVELVQAPAWRERGGVTVPLAAGMELKSGDVLRTGAGARAYVMLADGSRVKLGAAARFTFHSRSLHPERSFRAALDVLAGAFRFTSGKSAKGRAGDVAIRVGTASIGCRGADLWGRTDSEGDLVALLAGRIDITRGGETAELEQPSSYFEAPNGQPAEVKALEPAALSELLRQTEIVPGDGAAGSRGKWRILAAKASSEAAALDLYDRIRDAGFAARIQPRRTQAAGWRYELLLGGLASAAEAGAVATRLRAATGLSASVRR
jgi:hypothetical protein